MSRVRIATLWTASVEVECPHCFGHQPNPDDGSFLWSVDQVAAHAGDRTCVECDEPIRVSVERPHITPTKNVPPPGGQ